ncbi:MAG: hypothetical protein Q4G21_09345 [Dermabacter sp.]|nr:hypothetical protein [Dermabacter sp.]
MDDTTVPYLDVEQSLALIEKGQQMAGHFPDAEDMDRARRILTGELSPEDAEVELQEALDRLSERARARAAADG